MGVLNNPAAAKIIINGPTQYGNVSDPFTISYSVYDTDPGGDLGLDFFLDNTCVWFDSKKFDVNPYDHEVWRHGEYTIPSSVWIDIYDGPHTIIIETRNGTNYFYNQAFITFTRTGNPKRGDSSLSTGINPLDPPSNLPTISDNETVKMGILCRKYIDHGKEKIVYVKQKPSKLMFPDGHGTLFTDNNPRYRDGSVINTGDPYLPKDQMTFVDPQNESDAWTWIKATLPSGKTIFISTTFAVSDYIYPLTEIRVKLKSGNYILRNLTVQEWKRIDKAILEKIDFGNYASGIYAGDRYSKYYVPTRTSDTKKDDYYNFLQEYSDKQYNDWIKKLSNHRNERFKAMTYISTAKAKAVDSWKEGWSYNVPIHYGMSYSDLSWIPVLELVNTDPIIDLPDKHNSDPTIDI